MQPVRAAGGCVFAGGANGTPALPKITDAVANMRVIEAVFESQRTGCFVAVPAG